MTLHKSSLDLGIPLRLLQPKILIDAGPSGEGFSSVESFLRCERLYYHLRVQGREVKPPSDPAGDPTPLSLPLFRGSLVHIGLAHEYTRRNCRRHGIDPDSYYTSEEAMNLFATKEGLDRTVFSGSTKIKAREVLEDIAKPIVHNYFHHWDGMRETLHVVAIESEVRAVLGEFGITQRFDMVTEDGGFWIYDHKCSSETSKHKIVSRYTMSGQFLLMQSFGHQLYGSNFRGVRLNILTAIPPYNNFYRVSPEPTPNALAEFPAQISAWRERIASLKGKPKQAYLMAMNEQICVNNYDGRCPVFEKCQWGERASGSFQEEP